MRDTQVNLPPPAPVHFPGISSPTAVWRAAVAQRRELTSQLDNLREQRSRLSERLQESITNTADRRGLEAQLTAVDAQVADVQKRLAAANEQVAATAAVPGAVIEEPRIVYRGPSRREMFPITALFMLVALLPISLAFARRIWRRGAASATALPGEFAQVIDRLARLEQAIDSVAVEVERVGEGQRFVTRLMGERRSVESLPVRRDP